jgi:hypothetical protein
MQVNYGAILPRERSSAMNSPRPAGNRSKAPTPGQMLEHLARGRAS